MTREEIAEFVRKVFRTNGTMEAADIIAAAWEQDVENKYYEGRSAGWDQGQQQMYETGYVIPSEY